MMQSSNFDFVKKLGEAEVVRCQSFWFLVGSNWKHTIYTGFSIYGTYILLLFCPAKNQ